MSDELKIHDMPGSAIYIENAFPLHKKFLSELEALEKEETTRKIIPEWAPWVDGGPVKVIYENSSVEWVQVLDSDVGDRGHVKYVDWDLTINKENNLWPRKQVSSSYSDAHKKCYEVLRMIDEPYQKVLKIWEEKTSNQPITNYVTKNYTIRRYRTGGNMGTHIDINRDNPSNSMDWTALIYLNDDYRGGELVFDDFNLKLKPSAGSVIFFPCDLRHSVRDVLEGTKSYIFLFIHLGTKISTSVGEPYRVLETLIKKSNS